MDSLTIGCLIVFNVVFWGGVVWSDRLRGRQILEKSRDEEAYRDMLDPYDRAADIQSERLDRGLDIRLRRKQLRVVRK